MLRILVLKSVVKKDNRGVFVLKSKNEQAGVWRLRKEVSWVELAVKAYKKAA